MSRLPWSFMPKICLPMSDPSYNPFGDKPDNGLLEEISYGFAGTMTLYCRYGCCGDTRNPVCCDPTDDVSQGQFKTYKLVAIVAAGVAGVCIIAAIILMCVKSHMKKRRLIRDIMAINKMNNMTGIAPDVKEEKQSKTNRKPKKLFKSKKKPIPVQPMGEQAVHNVVLASSPPTSTGQNQPSMINGKINIPDKPIPTISSNLEAKDSSVDYDNEHYMKSNIFQPPPPAVYKCGYVNGYPSEHGNGFTNGYASGLLNGPTNQNQNTGFSNGHLAGPPNHQTANTFSTPSGAPKASVLLKTKLDAIIKGDDSTSGSAQTQNRANEKQEEKATFSKPNPFTGKADGEWGAKSKDPLDDFLLFLDENPDDL